MLCAIWYQLYNFKNVKDTHGKVLLFVKLQALGCNFTKSNIPHGCFSSFLNCKTANTPCNALYVPKRSIRYCKIHVHKNSLML